MKRENTNIGSDSHSKTEKKLNENEVPNIATSSSPIFDACANTKNHHEVSANDTYSSTNVFQQKKVLSNLRNRNDQSKSKFPSFVNNNNKKRDSYLNFQKGYEKGGLTMAIDNIELRNMAKSGLSMNIDNKIQKKHVRPPKFRNTQYDEEIGHIVREGESDSVQTEGDESYYSSSFNEQSYTEQSADEDEIILHLPRSATCQDFSIQNVADLTRNLRMEESQKLQLPRSMSVYHLQSYLNSLENQKSAVPHVIFKYDTDHEAEYEVMHVHKNRSYHPSNRRLKRKHHGKKIVKPPIYLKNRNKKATWLELFFDLFFVGTLSELSHFKSLTWSQIAKYVGLFLPLWWAWCHQALYANRFDSDDLVYRIVSLIQMMSLVSISLNLAHAFDTEKQGFVIGFMIYWTTLLFLYLLVYKFEAKATTVSIRYSVTFLFLIVCWGLSLLFDLGYILWYISIMIDFVVNVIFFSSGLEKIPYSASHLPERFGLFSIIVHGEFILGLINAAAGFNSAEIYAICMLGTLTIFCVWWIYYDDFDGTVVSNTNKLSKLWIYIHFPLHMIIAFVGTVFRVLIEEAGHNTENEFTKDTFIVACGLMLIFNALLKLISSSYARDKYSLLVYLSRVLTGIGFMIFVPFASNISIVLLVMVCSIFCSLQVIADVIINHLAYLEENRVSDDSSVKSTYSYGER